MAAKVPDDVMRKALKGRDSALKVGYLDVAPKTPSAPAAVPTTPPMRPPTTVALQNLSEMVAKALVA